jgi:hypothetical protein
MLFGDAQDVGALLAMIWPGLRHRITTRLPTSAAVSMTTSR